MSRHRTRLTLAVLTAASVSLGGCLLSPTATAHPTPGVSDGSTALPSLPNGSKTNKTLVIGLDGTMLNRIDEADAPHLQALDRNGLRAQSSLYSMPMAHTASGPGWSTIATGVWPDKHHVKDNSVDGKRFTTYPDFLTRLERADPDMSTLAIASWAPLTSSSGNGDVFSDAVDLKIATPEQEYDQGTTSRARHYLKDANPDATFVQLDGVDEAGHNSGSDSQEYLDAIAAVDKRVGALTDAVRSRPTYTRENWNILVTADHGHKPTGGHGGNSTQERQTFLLANGPNFPRGTVRHDVRLTDVAATVLCHEGVRREPALDGTAVNSLTSDAFDGLRPRPRGPVDESDIPDDTLGWTHATPKGWSVDNSRMPDGGTTEWRGWSFTTDDFWTRTEAGQGRENNVRSRNVFAVADSDEWADHSPGDGGFDSTLISPAYDVADSSRATASFTTTYKASGKQRGRVLVSFDGTAPRPVTTYTKDVNGVQKLTFDVPKGAKHARLHFRYTGDNDWFWTVDQVAVQ